MTVKAKPGALLNMAARFTIALIFALGAKFVHAEGPTIGSFGVTVTLKNGLQVCGYHQWADSVWVDETFSIFRPKQQDRFPRKVIPDYIVNFEGRDKIPEDHCHICPDDVYQVWLDLFNLKAARSFAELDDERKRAIFLVDLKKMDPPMDPWVRIKGSDKSIPMGDVRRMDLDPSRPERIELCGTPELPSGVLAKIEAGQPYSLSEFIFDPSGMSGYKVLSFAGVKATQRAENLWVEVIGVNYVRERWERLSTELEPLGIFLIAHMGCD